MDPEGFSARLIAWHGRHGRKGLPWQQPRTPYRVWVSEVMLQQTRVETVIPYFERFLARFPDVAALASAELDEVLRLWSGLGYYARARHLHRAARLLCERHAGVVPAELEALTALPGVGRSTAGAILALAHGARHPILDGNVKRVLARYHRLDGWPGDARVAARLWALADAHTPARRVAEYTQAIMDLGATVCRRRRPACEACPVAGGCAAHRAGEVDRYPAPRRPRALPVRTAVFVLARDPAGAVLLERRPASGLWGGLWTLPECASGESPRDWCLRRLGSASRVVGEWPTIRHTFSHFHLDILPVALAVQEPAPAVLEQDDSVWYKPGDTPPGGLAAPVARLLERLATTPFGDPP